MTAGPTRPGTRGWSWAWLGLGFAALGVLFVVAALGHSLSIDGTRYFWLDDDQMISMRYARNLADGHGLVWNPGERVEGYTNFLWTVVMAGVHLLPLADAHTSLAVLALNGLCAALVLIFSARLLAELAPGSQRALPVLLLLLCTCNDLVYWATNGFETTLLTALFVLSLARLAAENRTGCSRWSTFLAMGLIPLVRSDAHLLWLTVAAFAWHQAPQRARTLRMLIVSGLLPLLHQGMRLAYYGEWFPNTYYLKVGGNQGLVAGGLGYVAEGLLTSYWLVLLIALAGARKAGEGRRWVLLGGFALAMLSAVWVGGDTFPGWRFLAPWVPVAFVLAIAGTWSLVPQPGLTRVAVYAALVLSGLVFSLNVRVAGGIHPFVFPPQKNTNGGPTRSLVTGLGIREHTDQDVRVAVHAAGLVPYFSRRYCIDWLGKTDAHVARLEPEGSKVGHNKIDPMHSLETQRADLAVMLWLPKGLGACNPMAIERVRATAPRWVGTVYLSEPFQRQFCGNVIEPRRGSPVYWRSASAQKIRAGAWQRASAERVPGQRASGQR